MKGLIIKQISNQYQVYSENNELLDCIAMGKLRLGKSPKVGDHVNIVLQEGKYCIEKIEERKNDLIRPSIANVDQVVILMSCVEPDFSNKLLDRLLMIVEYHHIKPVIVFTKMDLIQNELDEEIKKYRNIGYDVYIVGKDSDLSVFSQVFANKVSVLTGNSGVGKSSLLNRLDDALALKTQPISKALGRGKHTTRHTQLFPILGGWIGDTPGFSSLDFTNFDIKYVKDCFVEFNKYDCRYMDCIHINEPDCGVKQHLGEIVQSRYENYLEIISLIKGGKK